MTVWFLGYAVTGRAKGFVPAAAGRLKTGMSMRKTATSSSKSLESRHEVAGWVQLARAFDAHHRNMLAMLAPHDLTGPQFDVLATSYRQEGLTQQEVADNLLVTKGNVALVIDNLERDGLIERRVDKNDGRLKRLYVTENGRQKLDKVFKSHAKTVKQIWRTFSDGEIENLTALLRKLEANCLSEEPKVRAQSSKSAE